jgi:hypothetical protein
MSGGSRSRTNNIQIMSLTSYQLLYPADNIGPVPPTSLAVYLRQFCSQVPPPILEIEGAGRRASGAAGANAVRCVYIGAVLSVRNPDCLCRLWPPLEIMGERARHVYIGATS